MSGPFVMRLLELATGRLTPDSGKFLRAYDPSAFGGRGLIDCTTDPAAALQFPDHTAAYVLMKQASGVRPDGKPNRPLTAWTVEVIPLAEAHKPSLWRGEA